MDSTENQIPAPAPAPQQEDLQMQLDRLQHLVHSVLILAIVVSGTLAVYLFNQLRYVRKELEQVRTAAAQYNKTTGPATDEFVKRLAVFSKTHPDYQAIATKYGLDKALTNTVASNAPAPSKAVPAPAKK